MSDETAPASSEAPPRRRGDRNAAEIPPAVLCELTRALAGLRFGTVTLVVQDGVVVQIDRLQKTRLR